MDDATEAIDMEELKEIMDDDDELINECFEDFLNDSPEMLADIKKAIDTSDGSRLEKAAHKIKGSLKYLAANKAAEFALQLEDIGKKNNFGNVEEVFRAFEDACGEVKKFMTNYP